MFRKTMFTLILLALVASTGAVLAQDGVTLRFASFQSGAVIEKFEEQFAEFEAMTGIKVVNEYVPWIETVERYLTMAAGDDLPDVAMVSAQWHRTLAARGVLSELAQEQFDSLDFGDFWPRLLAAYNYDGVQYGLPTDLDLQLIYYNKDLFDAAGVAYPEAGWTWDDYRAMATELTEGDGVGKIYGSNDFSFGEMRMITWAYGGDFIDAETGEALMTSEPVQRAMGLLAGMMVEDESMVLPGAEGMTIDRYAMAMYGPWGSWYVYRDAEFDWDVAPVPMGTEESVLAWGSTIAALGSSEHQAEIRQFLEFFLSPEKQYQRAQDWAWFPPGMAATEVEGFNAHEVLGLSEEQKQFVIDSVANGRAPFVHREEARLQNVYNQELSLVTAGLKAMPDALETIQAEWEEILAE